MFCEPGGAANIEAHIELGAVSREIRPKLGQFGETAASAAGAYRDAIGSPPGDHEVASVAGELSSAGKPPEPVALPEAPVRSTTSMIARLAGRGR